ncbi:HMG-box domain-containing protein [Aspergillus thermomutatus]|uniref:HMG box domain-containing protein n=1 Tax=Aspergillus thermomutatus TaxID=41047 RepID=A0A397GM36_ASPTH|nr:uncharacterized protein CDV56_102978 [Aspergillus thermomutatus]RHZ51557.1 hypothetical protein CDV56_102978 [Aspergillus thermomutatus]
MSYDRVLPNPALLYDASQVPLPRRSNNLLDYKIMEETATKVSLVNCRVDGGQCRYTAEGPATGPPRVPISSKGANPILGRIDSDPPVASPKLAVPARTKDMPVPEQSSQMGRSSSSSPVKSTTSKESVMKFCLCQTIPRPMNVVAQNPGLGNPDISKIIGQKWKELPQETKNEWHALAKYEKARHMQQYPEYRYQPRRYSRDGINSCAMKPGISHNLPFSAVCNRCGGRVMAHPSCRSLDSKRRQFNSQVSLKPNVHRERTAKSPYAMSLYAPRTSAPDAQISHQMVHPWRTARCSNDHPPHDPSLKLPPLQTTAPLSPSMTPITPFPNDGSSLDATLIYSLHQQNQSSRQDVKAVLHYLNSNLQMEGNTNPASRDSYSADGQMGDAAVDFLNTISVWYCISDDIVSSVEPVPGRSESKPEDHDCHSKISPKTIISKTADVKTGSSAQPSENGLGPAASVSGFDLSTVPIAPVPASSLPHMHSRVLRRSTIHTLPWITGSAWHLSEERALGRT